MMLYIKSSTALFAHGNSLGVKFSYSFEFLICIKFCATIATDKNTPACFARLVRSTLFTTLGKLVFFTFWCLNNPEFNSWIVLWNWFNCLLLLTHYLFDWVKNWEKQLENWDKTLWQESWTSCLWRMLSELCSELFSNSCALSVSRLIGTFDYIC